MIRNNFHSKLVEFTIFDSGVAIFDSDRAISDSGAAMIYSELAIRDSDVAIFYSELAMFDSDFAIFDSTRELHSSGCCVTINFTWKKFWDQFCFICW